MFDFGVLHRYEMAMRALQEVIAAMQAGNWEDAQSLYTAAKTTWQEIKDTCDLRFDQVSYIITMLLKIFNFYNVL